MNQQKLEKWIAWLDRINPEVYYLLENRKVFRFLVKEHNTGRMADPRLWSFIKSNYQGNMTMCITRQVDMDNQAISLLALLKDLLSNAGMITRKWFIDNYDSAAGESIFDQLFGEKDTVDTDKLAEDIKGLKGSSEAIKNHRNK